MVKSILALLVLIKYVLTPRASVLYVLFFAQFLLIILIRYECNGCVILIKCMYKCAIEGVLDWVKGAKITTALMDSSR